MESRADPAEGAEEDKQPARLKFIFCIHTPENAAGVARQLEDCSVIALEGVLDQTASEQLERAEVYTTFLSAGATVDERNEAVSQLDGRDHGLFINGLMENLEGSDKKVAMIDITRDQPEHVLLERALEADRQFDDLLRANRPLGELRTAYLNAMKSWAEASKAREAVMADKLRKLAEQHPGKVIGVVAGPVHSPVQHVHSKTLPTQRLFEAVGQQFPAQPREHARYIHRYQLMRQLRLRPGAEVSEILLDRAVLDEMYLEQDFYLPEERKPTPHEVVIAQELIQARIVDRMSDEQVEPLHKQIDAIKLAHGQAPSKQIDGMVHGVLVENKKSIMALSPAGSA